jgi:hypothetical protein
MAFFRQADISVFKEDRAKALEEFAEKAKAYVREYKPEHEFLSDVLAGGGLGLAMLRTQPWFGQSPVLIDRGNLDVLAGFVTEWAELSFVWPYVSSKTIDLFQRDLAETGLHGIHFRMDLKDEAARIEHTCKLADYVFDTAYERRMNKAPLVSLTSLTEGRDEAVEKFIATGAEQRRGPYGLTHEELESLTFSGARDWISEGSDNESVFRRSVQKMLSSSRDVGKPAMKELAERVQSLLVPLVYNYGYKLKAKGTDNQSVLESAARRVDVIFDYMSLSPALREGLKRQILINLFSAFPDGLELLQARREELQGVMLNRVFFDDPMGKLFRRTLAGPVELFSQCNSVEKPDRGFGVINFLAKTPYAVDLNIGMHGFLSGQPGIVHLAHQRQGWSLPLEQRVERGVINRVLGIYLSHAERLERYSDAAVLKLVEHIFDKYAKTVAEFNGLTMMPTFYKSPASVLKARPHLLDPVIKMTEAREIMNPAVFEWCGIGGVELKALGDRVPNALKSFVLESSMGL